MSGLSAINSANVNFQGRKKQDKAEKKNFNISQKITQPVKNEFHKAYGEDAQPTPKLVADFVSDNVVKIAVGVGGAAFLLARSRKATDGLTKALKENFAQARTATNDRDKMNIFKAGFTSVKNAYSEIKLNNLERAQESVKNAAESGEKSIMKSISDNIFRPVKTFDMSSKLNGVIESVSKGIETVSGKFGKKVEASTVADNIRSGFMKVGIQDGSSLADTAIASGATVVLSSSANEIADNETSKDNKKLAREASIQAFEKGIKTIDKALNVVDMIAG